MRYRSSSREPTVELEGLRHELFAELYVLLALPVSMALLLVSSDSV